MKAYLRTPMRTVLKTWPNVIPGFDLSPSFIASNMDPINQAKGKKDELREVIISSADLLSRLKL